MLSVAVALVIEDYDPRTGLKVITPVRPKIGFFGFTAAWIQLRHGGLIRVQGIPLQQVPDEPVNQGLQGHADLADPICQGGPGQVDAATAGYLLQPV
jgi:hypothetical protein